MSTIQNLFQQTQLAEAAYADFSGINVTVIKALQKEGLSEAQATDFVTHWKVVDQYTAPWLTGSGFSSTVFQRIDTDSAGGYQAGQYVFAVRGTEPGTLPPADLVADISGIGSQGIALRQAMDLYNYRKSLGTVSGQTYQAAYLKTDLAETALLTPLWTASKIPGPGLLAYNAYKAGLESAGYWVEGTTVSTLALGTSNEVPVGTGLETGRSTSSVQLGASYDVVGHSLGGHLAMVLGRLDQNAASVETFNPPFFDPFTSDKLSERFFTQLKQLELVAVGTSGISDGFTQSQNYEVSGDLVHLIGARQPGEPSLIFSETEDTNAVSAHSIKATTDSLAVYDLFIRLDSAFSAKPATETLAQLKVLFEAGSNKAATSLENLVNGLSKLLSLPPTSQAEFTREQLYSNVNAIRDAIAAGTGITHAGVISLAGQSAATVLTKAQQNDAEGEAYRYALQELNPFVVIGVNYIQHNTHGELDLNDPATGAGLTDNWLTDRAAMLAWQNKLNGLDVITSVLNPYITNGPSQHFKDIGSGKEIYLNGLLGDPHQFIFGGDGADSIQGLTASDRLYGGAGADILTGGQGNDYLEGGTGYDTYIYDQGDGVDTILDVDGNGAIIYNNILLTGGSQYGDSRVHRDATGHTYTDVGQGNLVIDGNILVMNWQVGNLGLNMTGPTVNPANPASTRDIIGDLAPIDFDLSAAGVQVQVDDLSNIKTDSNAPALNRADYFLDSTGNDHIIAGGGDDIITAYRGGDDLIDGGAGNDVIRADGGDDVVTGGSGSDVLSGGVGNDRLYADSQIDVATAILDGNTQTGPGQKGDWLAAGSGDDTVIDNSNNDVLTGGGGNDIIFGGTGNDLIDGDGIELAGIGVLNMEASNDAGYGNSLERRAA